LAQLLSGVCGGGIAGLQRAVSKVVARLRTSGRRGRRKWTGVVVGGPCVVGGFFCLFSSFFLRLQNRLVGKCSMFTACHSSHSLSQFPNILKSPKTYKNHEKFKIISEAEVHCAGAAARCVMPAPVFKQIVLRTYRKHVASDTRMSIVIRVFSQSGQRRVNVDPTATLADVHAALVKDLQTVITVKAAQVSLFADRECTAPYPDLSLSLSSLGLNKNGSMIFAKHPPISSASLKDGSSSTSPPRGGNVR